MQPQHPAYATAGHFVSSCKKIAEFHNADAEVEASRFENARGIEESKMVYG